MKYKYFVGPNLLCESATRVKFTDKFPSVREVVEDEVLKNISKKNKETDKESAIIVKEEE